MGTDQSQGKASGHPTTPTVEGTPNFMGKYWYEHVKLKMFSNADVLIPQKHTCKSLFNPQPGIGQRHQSLLPAALLTFCPGALTKSQVQPHQLQAPAPHASRKSGWRDSRNTGCVWTKTLAPWNALICFGNREVTRKNFQAHLLVKKFYISKYMYRVLKISLQYQTC